jgi:hypothetical protein
MYSPKIVERLIPPLYRLARARGQHMTTLVNEAVAAYLAGHDGNPPVAAADPRRIGGAASRPRRSALRDAQRSGGEPR